jgi:hypothetical protein
VRLKLNPFCRDKKNRKKIGKNHKIYAVEFIEKPLEMEKENKTLLKSPSA